MFTLISQDCSTFYTTNTISLRMPMETAESIMPVVRDEIVVTDCETIGNLCITFAIIFKGNFELFYTSLKGLIHHDV